MWFYKDLNALSKTISKAIDKAGYKPLRMDELQHNNKIDDEIIAQIRNSKFVVADFTGRRGGVYFEAGFALGLGIPVIWVCREKELKRIHFDNRQYNFILWDEKNLHELEVKLINRIEATIGRGPNKNIY
jgi:nucleoside 2-deoxyribosyltransferase